MRGRVFLPTRDARLTEKYIWPVDAEQQATPQQIASAIEFVKANDVAAVCCESTVSDRPMQQVVDATDAGFEGTLYVDSLSEANGLHGPDRYDAIVFSALSSPRASRDSPV